MNKVESGVRVIHILTYIAVVSTEERSQYLNKQKALKRLQAILETMKREQKPSKSIRHGENTIRLSEEIR